MQVDKGTIKIRVINDPQGSLVAYAEAHLPEIDLFSMKIVRGSEGKLFLSMPQRKVEPADSEPYWLSYYRLRQADLNVLQQRVLTAYAQARAPKKRKRVNPPVVVEERDEVPPFSDDDIPF